MSEQPGRPPLMVRFTRSVSLGRNPESGEILSAAPGDELDLVQLELLGALRGSDNISAERFGGFLVSLKKAELVNARDAERIER